MAKLAHIDESVIHVGIIVLNLDKWLRDVIFWLIMRGSEWLRSRVIADAPRQHRISYEKLLQSRIMAVTLKSPIPA